MSNAPATDDLDRARSGRFRAFPRIELWLGLGGGILILGLALWRLQNLRKAADVAQSLNNLKNLSFASRRCSDLYGFLPPGVGSFPRPGAGPQGTVFFFLATFMDDGANNGWPVVPGFLAPADPTLPASHVVRNEMGVELGATSYAANGYVFSGDPDRVVGDSPPVCANDPMALLPRTFGDGTANTILFMEKYAVCAAVDPQRMRPGYEQNTPGEHAWANHLLGVDQSANTNGYNSNWVPIQISLLPPQFRPDPSDADCMLPQSFSSHGACVAMADGSTHTVRPGISASVWSFLLLPNDGKSCRLIGSIRNEVQRPGYRRNQPGHLEART
jgi:hypothetical protein